MPRAPKTFSVSLGAQGRLVLPAAIRNMLQLEPGDRLALSVEPDGSLRAVSAREPARRARGLLKGRTRRSLASDLLEDRKREAGRK
jgi:AbrB family looped-hinge helix DNA binding protein